MSKRLLIAASLCALAPAATLRAQATRPELKAVAPATFAERPIGKSGATIRVPADWKIDGDDNSASFAAPDKSGVVNTQSIAKPTGDTLDAADEGMTDTMRRKYADLKIVAARRVRINGADAAMTTYDLTLAGRPRRWTRYVLIAGRREWVIDLICAPASAARLAATFDQVAASLKLPARPNVAAEPVKVADFVEHGAGDTGVTLRAPKSWVEQSAAVSGIALNLVKSDGGNASANLIVEPVAHAGQTLKQTREAWEAGVRAGLFEGATLVKSEEVRINGLAVNRGVLRVATPQGLAFCTEPFCWVADGRTYALTFTAAADELDALQPTFDAIAASVTFPAGGAAAADAAAKKNADALAAAKPLDARPPASLVEKSLLADGLTIRVPPDWTPQPLPAGVRLLINNPAKTASIALTIVSAPAGLNTANAIEHGRRDVAAHGSDGTMLVGDFVRLGGEPAARVAFEARASAAVTLRICTFTIVRDGRMIVVTFSAPAGDYDALLPVAEQVASTLRFAPANDAGATPPDVAVAVPANFVERWLYEPQFPKATSPGQIVKFDRYGPTCRTPADWTPKDDNAAGGGVTFVSPDGKATVHFGASGGHPDRQSLDVARTERLDALRRYNSGTAAIVRDDFVTLAGRLCMRLTADVRPDERWDEYLLIDEAGGTATFSFGCPASQYEKWRPIFEQIVASAKLPPTPAGDGKPFDKAAADAGVEAGLRKMEAMRKEMEAHQAKLREAFERQANPAAPAAPVAAAADEQLKRVDAGWQASPRPPVALLKSMRLTDWSNQPARPDPKNAPKSDADGVVALSRGEWLGTTQRFKPPVTFRVVALATGNDVRLAYAFDQLIFNWEMHTDELRIDGGPASGQHKPGAGALPAGEWVGIEVGVTARELVVRVDGEERYRAAGDFSKVDAPFALTPHNGSMLVKSIDVVR